MTSISKAGCRIVAVFGAIVAAIAVLTSASAQFSPPSTVFGSIADAAGPVPAGLTVEAYIGDKLCGTKGRTEFTGEGSSRVTVYVVDVVSEQQTAGCGKEGSQIRIKVGDRFASQVAKWNPGPVQLDLTFGNVTPAAIPTFTPAPTRTPDPAATPVPGETPAQVGTIPPGSPGAGSPIPTSPRGGITSATPGQQAASPAGDGGGVPFWAIALFVLGGIGAVGGGVGYVMSRANRASAPDDFGPPGED